MMMKILAKLKQVHPNGGTKCRWSRLKLVTFDKSLAITRKRRSSQALST